MYIKKVKKRNGRTQKVYHYLHLVENIRTENGPRPKLILNLGSLDIHPSQFKPLARRIQDLLTGQQSFVTSDETIEKYAKHAADKIFEKRAQENENNKETDYQDVDLNSIAGENARSLGPEYVCHSIWNELALNKFFISHHVPASCLSVIEALVVGRLVEPASELHTKSWAEERSALYEMSGAPVRHSLNSYYRASDRILELQDDLESYLVRTEQDMFSLEEKYFLFDLTNSYMEGECAGNTKARYGHSKEKRSDCKLVTLGLVVDESGFAKCSKLFEGNRNEATTLESMIRYLEAKTNHRCMHKTIVMDAGIASADNVTWLREHGYHYIVVNRGNAPFEISTDNMTVIKEDRNKDIKIEVKRYRHEEEVYIYCRSLKKQKKEESMRTRIEQLFIERLRYYKDGLGKPNRLKGYVKVVEAVGRLKEKYSKSARYYTVNVIPQPGKEVDDKSIRAIDITWGKRSPGHEEKIRDEGTYILRSDRTDLSDKEIWDMYIMLRQIEYSFLCMKSYLGIRPNFHQKEDRMDAHMFIAVVAYHILHIIEYRLRRHGDSRKWDTVRNILKTHQRLTVSLHVRDSGRTVKRKNVRINTTAEPQHKEIYRKLGISLKYVPKRKMIDFDKL